MSMMRWPVLFLLLLTARAPGAAAQEADDATRRAIARDEWYNDVRATRGSVRSRDGGPWSPEFRRFMMEAAARERQKWGALVPGNGEVPLLPAPGDRVEARGGASWLNLGPTKADFLYNGIILFVTDSGRVRNIVPHPQDANVLYVSFSGGGVWKTIDGGTTWAPLTEALGSLSTGWLAMDPGNSNVLYLGLGDPFDGTGIGLVKSTNAGATWSNPVFLGDATVIAQVMVSPADSSVVLAATNRGLYRSTNGGTSFSPVSIATGQPTPPYVWSIASTGGSKFVLALEAVPGTLGQIWISADNGASWTQGSNVTSPLGVARMTVASAPSAPNIVYALASTSSGNLADIYRSTTGGAFWRSLRATSSRTVYTNPNPTATRPTQLFNTQGWYDQMLLVNPANPNEAFYGGALHTAKVVVGSMGAADRWTMISEWLGRYNLPYVHADAHAAAYDAAGRLYFGTDGGVFMSPDNGVNFTDRLNIGIVTHLIYNLGSSTAAGSLVVGGFQDNGTRTRSGATSTFNQTIGGDGFGCDVHKTDGSLVLGSLYNARIQKSTNGGVNFSPACSGIAECGTSSAPFYTKVVPWTGSATGDVVFTHSNTRMYKSANYADSWTGLTPVPTGTIRNINVAHSNPDVLGIVASGGAAYVSNNGGTSWTPVATLPNNGLSLSYIWFDRADPNIVYVSSVAPNASATHLWKSLNFGQSWTAIDGGGFPTGVPVDVIKTDPLAPATLYAGTHLGVYRSDDAGANWVRYGSGLPLVEVTDVYISADASLVRASTFGRGFWELVP